MLDVRSKYVLKFIVNECNEGTYKIIDATDIISFLPKKYKADTENVAQIIKHLENGDYVSVKYSDEEQFCLCPSPFGRQFIENEDIQNKNKTVLKHLGRRNNLGVLLFALLGAFLGTLIYNLLL